MNWVEEQCTIPPNISNCIPRCSTLGLEISVSIDASWHYTSSPHSKVIFIYNFRQNKTVYRPSITFPHTLVMAISCISFSEITVLTFSRLFAAHATSCWASRNTKLPLISPTSLTRRSQRRRREPNPLLLPRAPSRAPASNLEGRRQQSAFVQGPSLRLQTFYNSTSLHCSP